MISDELEMYIIMSSVNLFLLIAENVESIL